MAKPASDTNAATATAPVKYNVGWRRVVRNFSPSYDTHYANSPLFGIFR